jgi:hypothetical protein
MREPSAKREPNPVREPGLLRARWHEESDAAGEPQDVADLPSRPAARFYAPVGTCVYCDRRRSAAAASMRSVRERGEM